MDNYNSWKKTEDMELDLADLFRRLVMQWKQALICMLAFGLLFAGLKLLQETVTGKEGSGLAEIAELTKEEMHSVTDAAELAKEIRQMEAYLEQSVLMKTDAFHKNKAVLLYSIDGAKRQEIQKILESYLSCVSGGEILKNQKKSGRTYELESWQLDELITAYQKSYSSPMPSAVYEEPGNGLQAEAVFCVEITGKDGSMTDELLSDMKDAVKQRYHTVKNTIGGHRLTLLSSYQNIVADKNLRSWQHEQRTLLSSYRDNLKNMTSAFHEEQMKIYQKKAGLEQESDEKFNLETTDGKAEKYAGFFKYFLLGLAAGMFGYGIVFACLFIFRDTVQSTEEMKRLYTFPVYGRLSVKQAGKRKPVKAKEEEVRAAEERITVRIRLACKKRRISRICIVSDFALDSLERKYLERIADRLQKAGIAADICENTGGDIICWDISADTGAILMVCTIGRTTHRMIDEAMEFYTENDISVMGAAVF